MTMSGRMAALLRGQEFPPAAAMPVFHCLVAGEPASQGSMRIAGGKVLPDNVRALKVWRTAVNAEALETVLKRRVKYGAALWPAGAIGLALVFWCMPRPPSTDPALVLHNEKPDLDKLQRAVLDALKGVLYADDCQVQTIRAVKYFTPGGETSGVEILAWREDLRS